MEIPVTQSKRWLQGLTSLTLAGTLSLTPALAAGSNISNGLSYLRTGQQTDGQVTGFPGVTDWSALAFAMSGEDPAAVKATGGTSIIDWLKTNQPTSASTAADWERRILAVTTAGQNPYDFGSTNLVAGLRTYVNNHQIGSLTQTNDDVFGLLALISAETPATDQTLADSLSFIIAHQNADGGYGYSTTSASDVDDTAAALMAFAAAGDRGFAPTGLATAKSNATAYLLSGQNSDGGFTSDPNPATSWDTTSNVSTTAWAAMALNALDDPGHASLALSYLSAAQKGNGSFPYQPSYPDGDTYNTAQSVMALTGKFWPSVIYSGTIPSVNDTSNGASNNTSSANNSTLITPVITPTPTPSTATSSAPQPDTATAKTIAALAATIPTPASTTTPTDNSSSQPTRPNQPATGSSPSSDDTQVKGVSSYWLGAGLFVLIAAATLAYHFFSVANRREGSR